MTTLSRRFFRAFLLLVALPSLVVSILLSRLYLAALYSTVELQSQATADQVAQNVRDETESTAVLAAALFYDGELRRLADRYVEATTATERFLRTRALDEKLVSFFTYSNRIGEVVLYLRNGARFGERFVLELDPQPGTESLLILRMILQPIVENAILHGFGGGAGSPIGRGARGTLRVTARREARALPPPSCPEPWAVAVPGEVLILEVLRRLRAEPPPRPPAVVVLSAHDDYRLVRDAFKLGAADYVVKSELDAHTLRAALEKAASGLAPTGERTTAILQRRQLELLKAQVLRDLLAAGSPPELEETFAGLGITLVAPFAVCGFWVEDLDAVARREGGHGLARFSEMVTHALRQALDASGAGEVVPLGPGHVVVLFSPAPPSALALELAARGFCEDAAGYLARCLSVKVTCSVGPACGAVRDAPGALAAARATRRVESRIVVLAKRASTRSSPTRGSRSKRRVSGPGCRRTTSASSSRARPARPSPSTSRASASTRPSGCSRPPRSTSTRSACASAIPASSTSAGCSRS